MDPSLPSDRRWASGSNTLGDHGICSRSCRNCATRSALPLHFGYAMGSEDMWRCTPGESTLIDSHRCDSSPAIEDEDFADEEAVDVNVNGFAPMRLEIGQLIEGRLRIVRFLGRGGMSEVYEAYDERAKRTVAVKVILVNRSNDARRAIFTEARSLVVCKHPHVVALYGLGAIGGQVFLELESAPRGSLAERVRASGALPVVEALEMLVKVADGLAALHACGIVHRDIKADNILLTNDHRPVIADLGLAIHQEDLPAPPGGIVGTPAYMAPEAILGLTETFEQYALADQYGLAVTAYFALTGTLPFEASTPSGLFYAQMAIDPDPPTRRRCQLPSEIDAVMLRALAKRAADRYASVGEFRDALWRVRETLETTTVSNPPRDSGVQSNASLTPVLKPPVVAA